VTEEEKPEPLVKTIAKGLLAWTVLALVVFGGMTTVRVASSPASDTEFQQAGAAGVAEVQTCQRQGPVTLLGVGYFWRCDALVRPDGQGAVRVAFGPGEMTPADIGLDVPVRLDDGEWQRNVVHPYGFMVYLGALLVLFGVFNLYVSPNVLGWLRFARGRTTPGAPGSATRVLVRGDDLVDADLPLGDAAPGDSSSGMWLFTAIGLVLTAFGVVSTVVLHDLADDALDPGYLVTVPLGLCGLAVLGMPLLVGKRRSDSGAAITVSFTPDGMHYLQTKTRARRLPWAKVRRLVFDEHRSNLVEISLSSLDDEGSAWCFNAFPPLRSGYGRVLTPAMPQAEAEKLAEIVEGFRPGVVFWPKREVRRGGLGMARAFVRTVIRVGRPAAAGKVVTEASGVIDASSGMSWWRALWAGIAVALVIVDFFVYARLWLLPVYAALGIGFGLYRTRYQGVTGKFVVTAETLTWRQGLDSPTVIERAALDRLTVTEKKVEVGIVFWRKEASVAVDGVLLADRVSVSAARRLRKVLTGPIRPGAGANRTG
jgi:hypothetical protein